MRVEKAFPAIIARAQLQSVGKHLSSRAPKFSHPRRVGSSYLLSGLAKCKTCNTPLIGRFAQSGKYSYYVCRGILKKCVNSQAVYPLSEQHGLKARERRYTAHEEGKHWQ